MIYRFKSALAATLAISMLSACASMSAVPAGAPFTAETAYTVTPSASWTRIPNALNPTKGSALTQDGVPLGAVYLVTVKNDKSMIDGQGGGKNVPRYTKGSTPLEQIDFLETSMNLIGYLDVSATNVRPATVDGLSGTQFGLTGEYQGGLEMKGNGLIVESDKGLNLVVYAAPALHYYDKYKTEADSIFNSVRLSQ